MNGRPVYLFFICLAITCLQSNQLSIMISEQNNQHKITSQLHSLTNKMLKLLGFGKEFSKNDRINVLLTMHNDLRKIAERHEKIHNSIRNMANFTDSKTTGLGKLFEDMITEETDRIENLSYDTAAKPSETLENLLERVINDMLDELFSVDGIIMPSVNNRVTKVKSATSSRRSNVRNIKIWHPPLSTELNGTRRLYKGKKTRIKEFPFLASIHVMNKFMCAGSIISKDLVITAATCLQIAYDNPYYSNRFRSIFVRVGSDYTEHSGELISVIDLHFHPEFDPVSLRNNLVLVRLLQRPRTSRKRKVQRIQYDGHGVHLDEVDVVTVLGWGDKSNKQRSHQMEKVSLAHLDIYEFRACKKIFSPYYVTDNNFCAGFENKGGGACNKDVGGPAIVQGQLIGVISFGAPVCGMIDAPTVFTKIWYHVDWINEIIRRSYQKADMRHAKILHLPMSTSIPPVITTSNVKIDNIKPLTGHLDEELDEIHLLQEILQEMIFTNDSVLDYILYGDLQFNDSKVNNKHSTTKSEFHQLLQNNSLLMKGNHKRFLRNEYESSSYEDSDTEIKVLESLVSQTKPTIEFITATQKRVGVELNRSGIQQQTVNIGKIVDNGNQKYNIDLNSYYEDDEMTYDFKNQDSKMKNRQDQRMPITPDLNHQYPKAITSKITTKSLNIEDYKHVIFKLNPVKESRSIITVDNKENKALENNSEREIIQNGEDKSSVRNDKGIKAKQTAKLNVKVPLGKAVAISDDDYDFDQSAQVKFNERSRNDYFNRNAIYWRFPSIA